MIDIHAHILPAFDDGARSLEEALKMGRLAQSDGIREMIVTPHATELGQFANPRSEAEARLEALREALSEHDIELPLYLGAEVNLVHNLPSLLDEGRLFPLHAGPYVLIHWENQPVFTEELIFSLQVDGYVPIIAHPERSPAVERNTDLLASLVARGALTQVTALSVTGGFGPRVKALTEQLLRRRLVHFIATDTHSIEPGRRAPLLAEAVELAARIVGQEEAEAMVIARPAAVLAGESVSVDAPLPAHAGRSFWPFARSR